MICQRYIKGATKDCFIFDSCLSSKKLAEAAMECVADLIDIVKTNTEVFCKVKTEKITNYWTGGSYLILRIKPIVPRGKSIIAIGYKYNECKVLSFIITDNTGIKQAGLTCLSKYPDQFHYVSILSGAHSLFMYNFSEFVNDVESHNK